MVGHEDIKNLAFAVQYWLSYWDTITRTNILQESSLRYAISEIIERRYNGTCVLEKTHPKFPSRRFDIVWAEPNCPDSLIKKFAARGSEQKSNQQLAEEIRELYKYSHVFELKIAKPSMTSQEQQEIFDDLCRLYFFKKEYPTQSAYFLLTGINELFNNQLPQSTNSQESLRDKVNKRLKDYLLNESGEELEEKKQASDEYEYVANSELTSVNETSNNDNKGEKQEEEATGLLRWLSQTRNIPLSLDYKSDGNYEDFFDDYNKKDERRKVNEYIPLSEDDKQISFITKPIAINYPPKDHETSHGIGIWEILLDNPDNKAK